MNIFVGNLLFEADEGDVKKLFERFGDVAAVVIVMEKEKKAPKSRGFGFVQMPEEQEALAAIGALNGKEFMGRALDVSPVRPKIEAPPKSKLKKKAQPKFEVKINKPAVRALGKPGTYGGGRRTRSYVMRRGPEGEPKPWRKSDGGSKPWKKLKKAATTYEKSKNIA